MADFLTSNALNAALEDIFDKASELLIIISPYIKLHPRFRDVLLSKRDNDKLEIFVVFGKNANNWSDSLSRDEFEFFKKFPNIQIKYDQRLHAKYYANEGSAILTSMNLWDYSQDNNIEFGIKTKNTILSTLTAHQLGGKLDKDAYDYFNVVIRNSELLYQRTPIYEGRMMGLAKRYIESKIAVDKLTQFYKGHSSFRSYYPRSSSGSNSTVSFRSSEPEFGYCIRTGERIPFNIKQPLSEKSYRTWSQFGDEDYEEKYCHYSGEESYGETSFRRPVLQKHWHVVKDFI